MKAKKELDIYFYVLGWIVMIILLGVGIYIHFDGLDFIYNLNGCSFKRMTGFNCPGCGGTRAVFFMFNGKMWESFKMHPIVLYGTTLYIIFMATQTIERLSFGEIKIALHYRDLYLWLALAIIVVNFLVKNLIILMGI